MNLILMRILNLNLLQFTSRYSASSNRFSMVRKIELERKHSEIQNCEELAKTRKSKLMLETDARKTRFLAEAEQAEALVNMRLEMINLEAKEKLLMCSEKISRLPRLHVNLNLTIVGGLVQQRRDEDL